MSTAIPLRTFLSLTVAATILCGTSNASGEEDPWQQERAAKLARQLADQTDDLRLTIKKAAPGSIGITRRKRYRLEEDLRLIRNSSKHLARKLEDGKGREETLATAQRIAAFIRDARVDAMGWTPPEWVESKLDPARNTVSDLAELYGAELADVFRKTPGVGAGQ